MYHLLTADNRPGFQWNVDTYAFVYLLRTNQYVSNQYILDLNPRLSSYTIGVTYLDYISLLLVCGDCSLTLKGGVCWNLLESTPDSTPLIKWSHKWNEMLFIISNIKLGIWLCSQPIIDINSQSNFYDVLTRPYKYLVQNTINTLNTTKCTQDNLHVRITRLWDFHAIIKQIYFLLHSSLAISYRHDNSWSTVRISMMWGIELPYKISLSEEILSCLRNKSKIVDDLLLHLN